MKTCQKCGSHAENDDTYCPECGTKLKTIKEPRKITLWTFLKIIGGIIVFIILINIFNNNPPIAIILLIAFLIWTNILNKILKKLFNVEISTSVKILVTIVLIVLSISTSSISVQKEVKPEFVSSIEGIQGHEFVEKINKIINSRDYTTLKIMFEKGIISQEVFEDIHNILESRDHININMNIKTQDYRENRADLIISAVITTDYEKRTEKTRWIFEKLDDKWSLIAIKPRLSELKLSKSLEQDATSKLRKIQEPIIAISKNGRISTDALIKIR